MKARRAKDVKRFEDIPNIGPSMASDFKALGIKSPTDLKYKDAYKLYQKICKVTGYRHDPCVLDTYMAAVDFMKGAEARPWYSYTPKRKSLYPKI
jgi:hypothetical protein